MSDPVGRVVVSTNQTPVETVGALARPRRARPTPGGTRRPGLFAGSGRRVPLESVDWKRAFALYQSTCYCVWRNIAGDGLR